MRESNRLAFRRFLLIFLVAIAMVLSYLAGTISVEAGWFAQDETRASDSQIAAVSAAVSLLLLGNDQGEEIFLPLILN